MTDGVENPGEVEDPPYEEQPYVPPPPNAGLFLVISNGKIVAEAFGGYRGPMEAIPAPEDYVPKSFTMPPSLRTVPETVTRASGVLALKRHRLVEGELVELAVDEEGTNTLYDVVIGFRDNMGPGINRDTVDIGLTSTLTWSLQSPTVQMMAIVIPLTATQLKTLFNWAVERENMF